MDDFRDRMADIEDRYSRLRAETLEIGQNLCLAQLIQRGERLVHQQDTRRAQERAADGDALLLAARQPSGPAVEQVPDPEDFDDLPDVLRLGAARCEPAAERKVLADREVGEQAPFLEHVADPTAMRRKRDPATRIEQDRIACLDPSLVRPQQARDRFDDRGLARARTPEQRRDAVGRGEFRVERESLEAMPERNVQAHLAATQRAIRRETNSEARRAAIATAIETTTSLTADDSPPGTWRKE